ncbi:ATP-binding protein [Lysinibacillus sp. LZ02]|uniref:HAMP domain-containing sensor histidine kinase n=1 Tax=Lysinibacillus sp. LZ02 TaxID=3420668 RepID=UPI003D36D121
MFSNKKKVSLLTYWTRNYVLTLVIGLTILLVISALWIRHTTTEHRVEMMEVMADEAVILITNIATGVSPEKVNPFFERREPNSVRDINPIVYMTDTTGTILSTNRPFPSASTLNFHDIIQQSGEVQHIKSEDGKYTIIKRSIVIDEELVGYVFVVEKNKTLTAVKQEFGFLVLVITCIGLLGWGAIYMLSKRLSKPIMEVAAAAKLVESGQYTISLPIDVKEQEVDELVTSFKEMVTRLEQLEKTRTELLAGVTHELKTPVTSISGLLQAVNDDVVTGDDAKEFIQMALTETTKMKTMIGDLLAFNSFSVNAVPVEVEAFHVNILVEEIIRRWGATHPRIKLSVATLEEDTHVQADLVRVQQILVNLLTNAEQAMDGSGNIHVSLQTDEQFIVVDVKDNGCGISLEEQPFIFERFYRGEQKKYKVRGLGLGLALSKMMAQSLGGDLVLIASTEQGTIFRLKLVKAS